MEIWGICFLRRRRIQKIMEFGVRELFGQSGIKEYVKEKRGRFKILPKAQKT